MSGSTGSTGHAGRILTGAELSLELAKHQLKLVVPEQGSNYTIESIQTAVPAPTIYAALMMRFRSRQDNSFGARMLSVMRNAFGGHAVKKG